jgi:hypothetical protein
MLRIQRKVSDIKGRVQNEHLSLERVADRPGEGAPEPASVRCYEILIMEIL